MKSYLVGGWVRDELLGHEKSDRDWVIVGGSEKELVELGFKKVGADFPVFLHPVTKEEYALARTERKTKPGYHGFSVSSSKSITLEEDLRRRDFTINAMAKDPYTGNLIDPFGGQLDLQSGILRHVSDAFVEDPLRVLRGARFAARLNFLVAEETSQLMQKIVRRNELALISPERIWKEFDNAMGEKYPFRFLEVLHHCGALKELFPEINAIFCGHHPYILGKLVSLLTRGKIGKEKKSILLSAVVAQIGETGREYKTRENRGLNLIKEFSARLRIPKEHRELSELFFTSRMKIDSIRGMKNNQVVAFLEEADAYRRTERFEKLLSVYEICLSGQSKICIQGRANIEYLKNALIRTKTISIKDLSENGNISGHAIREALTNKRIKRLAEQT